jgi:protein-disulfide isomerase
MAANQQGKFWEFHDLLFQNQKALTREDLEKYAQELKLDMPKFKAALDQKTHAAVVDGDMKLGTEVVVQGTPTMFINGARVANPTDFDAVSKLIDAELAKKK